MGSWAESGSPHLHTLEGESDSSGKVFTLKGECIDTATRKSVREKIVHTIEDGEHRTMVFYRLADDGTETKLGEEEYTRKK